MISHKHKCIFIHISKCAGSTIEKCFGIDVNDNTSNFNEDLFGWSTKHKLYLQHATPQQLIDLKLLDSQVWENYFKFIIVRNPYSRVISDYFWVMNESQVNDSFENYLLKKGEFTKIFNDTNEKYYRGDHLYKQKDYFFINQKRIKYDLIIRFENISEGFNNLIQMLDLKTDFFKKSVLNAPKNKKIHYSKFLKGNDKLLFESLYHEDLEFLNYSFEKGNFLKKFKSIFKK